MLLLDFELQQHATYGVPMFVDDDWLRAPPKVCSLAEWLRHSAKQGGESEWQWPHSSDSDPYYWLE